MLTLPTTEHTETVESRKREPYRRPYERSANPPRFILRESDIAILAAIYTCRVLTFPLIRDLFPPKR